MDNIALNILPYPKCDREINSALPESGYSIQIKNKEITIKAADQAGQFYAERTIIQLKKQFGDNLPDITISDYPKYRHRGFMLDVVRHFFGVEVIFKIIDLLASLKMNKLHLHLADDQGWRIEIDAFPLLTKVGGFRAQTRLDGKVHGGYYSKEDIRKIVSYAKENFIDVIPEIDMPGHFSAAIAAYPHLGCTGRTIKVEEGFGILPEIACAGKQATFDFIKTVLTEISALFPYEYIHLGGDEAIKLRYAECPDCQKKIIELNLPDEDALQGYFMREITDFLSKLGKKTILWNDANYGGAAIGIMQFWKENKKGKKAAEVTAAPIIFSPFGAYYFDYPHGMTPLKKTLRQRPDREIADKISGMEAVLWTEYIETDEQLFKAILPRLYAVAEIAWRGGGRASSYESKSLYLDFKRRTSAIYGLDIKKADPNPFMRIVLLLRFLRNMWDKTLRFNIKYLRISKKAVRKAGKIRLKNSAEK